MDPNAVLPARGMFIIDPDEFMNEAGMLLAKIPAAITFATGLTAVAQRRVLRLVPDI